MFAVLELLVLATAAFALRAPSSYSGEDYESPKPSALRDFNDSPRPALKRFDSPRPVLRTPKYEVDHDSPRPFRATPTGYQFSSFRGPVSGNIEEIEVPFVLPQGPGMNPYGDSRKPVPSKSVDYVAKPDYSFTYGMHDPESGVAQAQAEAREGDTVKGEYSVMEPDGTLRTVTYVADPIHGFQASVKYGPSGLPPPPPPTPTPTSGYTGPVAQPQGTPRAPQPLPHRFKAPRTAAQAPRPRPVYRSYQEYEDI